MSYKLIFINKLLIVKYATHMKKDFLRVILLIPVLSLIIQFILVFTLYLNTTNHGLRGELFFKGIIYPINIAVLTIFSYAYIIFSFKFKKNIKAINIVSIFIILISHGLFCSFISNKNYLSTFIYSGLVPLSFFIPFYLGVHLCKKYILTQ